MEHTITLINNQPTLDKYGVQVDNFTEREVFCDVRSASRSEFYQAAAAGLHPEYEVSVFFADYEGEELAKLDGVMYRILRTYRSENDEFYGDRISLTLERHIGTQTRLGGE